MSGKRHKIAGHEFIEVKALDCDPLGKKFGGAETVLIPYHPPDPHLEFPFKSYLETEWFLASSGIARHSVIDEKTQIIDDKAAKNQAFTARQLAIFNEDDWFGECFQVLMAHGWLDKRGRLSSEIISKVAEIEGTAEIEKAKKHFGENWEIYIEELASKHLAVPLSRLWYAANMRALYYVHYDDLRLGFLWCEYKIRMRHEADSFRGKKNVTSARSGGEARAKRLQGRTEEILQRMQAFHRSGKSVANAASLAFKAGLGTSPEANRKLWTRHRKK